MKKYKVILTFDPEYYTIEANDINEATIKGDKICTAVFEELLHEYGVNFKIEEII